MIVFNSIAFMVFFLVVVTLNYLLPRGWRWFLLLVASYYFYFSSEPWYVLFLVFSTLVDYFCGVRMARAVVLREKRYYLILSLSCNIGFLVIFKYLGFFSGVVNDVLHFFGGGGSWSVISIVAPLGISYFTFRKISYVVDIYRGNGRGEVNLGVFALYVSFFPQVVAGPIDRARDLLGQFRERHGFCYEGVTGGLKLVVWGLFKKMVVADRLANFVNPVFAGPGGYSGLGVVLGVLFFSFQVYADFSGYTDMAIGLARILGYRSAVNFDRPYFANSIKVFWQRWHMTLTSWLRDYVFLPVAYLVSRRLGGKGDVKDRGGWLSPEKWAYMGGVMVTMLLCGLWHGASWTFVVWGWLHGLYMVIAFITQRARKRFRRKVLGRVGRDGILGRVYGWGRVGVTFSLVTLLWVFFRAESIGDAFYILGQVFSGSDGSMGIWGGQPLAECWLAIGGIVVMLVIESMESKEGRMNMFAQKSLWVRWLIYIAWILVIMNFGVFEEVPFIYGQF